MKRIDFVRKAVKGIFPNSFEYGSSYHLEKEDPNDVDFLVKKSELHYPQDRMGGPIQMFGISVQFRPVPDAKFDDCVKAISDLKEKHKKLPSSILSMLRKMNNEQKREYYQTEGLSQVLGFDPSRRESSSGDL